jgi:hypothetical protein
MARRATHFSVFSLLSPIFLPSSLGDAWKRSRRHRGSEAEGGGGNAVTIVAGPWRTGLLSRGMGAVGHRQIGQSGSGPISQRRRGDGDGGRRRSAEGREAWRSSCHR